MYAYSPSNAANAGQYGYDDYGLGCDGYGWNPYPIESDYRQEPFQEKTLEERVDDAFTRLLGAAIAASAMTLASLLGLISILTLSAAPLVGLMPCFIFAAIGGGLYLSACEEKFDGSIVLHNPLDDLKVLEEAELA